MKSEVEKKFVKSSVGFVLNIFLFLVHISLLLAATVQLWIVTNFPLKERDVNLQELFASVFIPALRNDYNGDEYYYLIAALVTYLFTCVCFVYVIGRAIFDPKYTAGKQKFKNFWPLLVAMVLTLVLQIALALKFTEKRTYNNFYVILCSISNFRALSYMYTLEDDEQGFLCFDKPWRYEPTPHHLEGIKCTLGPGISSTNFK